MKNKKISAKFLASLVTMMLALTIVGNTTVSARSPFSQLGSNNPYGLTAPIGSGITDVFAKKVKQTKKAKAQTVLPKHDLTESSRLFMQQRNLDFNGAHKVPVNWPNSNGTVGGHDIVATGDLNCSPKEQGGPSFCDATVNLKYSGNPDDVEKTITDDEYLIEGDFYVWGELVCDGDPRVRAVRVPAESSIPHTMISEKESDGQLKYRTRFELDPEGGEIDVTSNEYDNSFYESLENVWGWCDTEGFERLPLDAYGNTKYCTYENEWDWRPNNTPCITQAEIWNESHRIEYQVKSTIGEGAPEDTVNSSTGRFALRGFSPSLLEEQYSVVSLYSNTTSEEEYSDYYGFDRITQNSGYTLVDIDYNSNRTYRASTNSDIEFKYSVGRQEMGLGYNQMLIYSNMDGSGKTVLFVVSDTSEGEDSAAKIYEEDINYDPVVYQYNPQAEDNYRTTAPPIYTVDDNENVVAQLTIRGNYGPSWDTEPYFYYDQPFYMRGGYLIDLDFTVVKGMKENFCNFYSGWLPLWICEEDKEVVCEEFPYTNYNPQCYYCDYYTDDPRCSTCTSESTNPECACFISLNSYDCNAQYLLNPDDPYFPHNWSYCVEEPEWKYVCQEDKELFCEDNYDWIDECMYCGFYTEDVACDICTGDPATDPERCICLYNSWSEECEDYCYTEEGMNDTLCNPAYCVFNYDSYVCQEDKYAYCQEEPFHYECRYCDYFTEDVACDICTGDPATDPERCICLYDSWSDECEDYCYTEEGMSDTLCNVPYCVSEDTWMCYETLEERTAYCEQEWDWGCYLCDDLDPYDPRCTDASICTIDEYGNVSSPECVCLLYPWNYECEDYCFNTGCTNGDIFCSELIGCE